jgi:serine/threonine protein kinase
LSDDARNLLLKMLDLNEETRIKAAEVLDHPWIKKGNKHYDPETQKKV